MGNTESVEIAGLSLNKVTAAAQVARAIREELLVGRLRPGVQLQEVPMAASVGVSRNTMREAIQILVREGLVRHNVNRGFIVTQLTLADIEDIYRVRRILEIAGVQAAEKVRPERLSAFNEIVEQISRSAEARDWMGTVASDLLFHSQIVSLLGSYRLSSFFTLLLSELRLGLMLIDQTTFDGRKLGPQHAELAELLQTRQFSLCEARLTQHLAESEQNLRDIFSIRNKC